jgi:GR25 family glycosyltransferase involved in LPS biosynthesis
MKIAKIYYINLDDDIERRERVERRIERHFAGIPNQRIRGIPADEIDRHEAFFRGRLVERARPVDGVYPLPGLIGCMLAHRAAMQAVHAEFGGRDARCLVLEDDCVFDGTVPAYLEGLSEDEIPVDWRALLHTRGRRSRSDRINPWFYDMHRARDRRWNWYWGTHFVVYRTNRVHEILDLLDRLEINSIDKWLRDNVEGLYSFTRRLRIKQSNLGGSGTNPDFAGDAFEDRSESFGLRSYFNKLRAYWNQVTR